MNEHLSVLLLYHQSNFNLFSTVRANEASHQVQSSWEKMAAIALRLFPWRFAWYIGNGIEGGLTSNEILSIFLASSWINWIPHLGMRMLPEIIKFYSYIIFIELSSSIKMLVKFTEAGLCSFPGSEIEPLCKQVSWHEMEVSKV